MRRAVLRIALWLLLAAGATAVMLGTTLHRAAWWEAGAVAIFLGVLGLPSGPRDDDDDSTPEER
jgi:hypothetical protein